MAVAVRIWRVLSWIMGCLCVLPMGYGLWMQLALPEELLLFPVVMCALWFLSSVLAPISAVGIKRQTRWGRPVGWVTACVQIVAFPLFTPLGVFGLILLFVGAGKHRPQVDSKKQASSLASTVGGVAVVIGVVVPRRGATLVNCRPRVPCEGCGLRGECAFIPLEVAPRRRYRLAHLVIRLGQLSVNANT